MSDAEVKGQRGGHLDEMTCMLYVERQLDRARGQEVSAHTQECAPCRTLLRAMERESRLLTRAMLEEDETIPARIAEFQARARKSMQWVWGVILGVAATGAYSLYSGYIEPWQQQIDQAGFGGSSLLSLLIFQGAFWKGWQSVITLFEVTALVSLACVTAAFFRRRYRGGSALALIMMCVSGAGICALLAMPQNAMATEFNKSGPIMDVGKDEVVHGDLFAHASRVNIAGTVEGDLFAFTEEVDVTGHVKGDVIAFANTVRITGQVDGNIRAFNNQISVRGTVGKNMLIFGQNITVESGAKVGGSLTTFSNATNVEGKLGGDMLCLAQNITITGEVGGEIHAEAETLVVKSGGIVGGAIHMKGQNAPQIDQDAKVKGPVDFEVQKHTNDARTAGFYIWKVIWMAAYVVFGLGLFLLMPQFSHETVMETKRYGAAAGLGLLSVIAVPIAAILACVSVVGLFVGISALFLWYAALYFAQIVVGAVVGEWIFGETSEAWPLMGRMVVGVLAVRLLMLIPHVGGWVQVAVVIWGIGGIALAIYRRFQPIIAANAPSAPYVPPVLPPNTTIGGVQTA